MAFVRTVTGDVDAGEPGMTYAHEHLLIINGMLEQLDADFALNDPARMAEEIAAFTAAGGRTLVDMMPPGLGRDPEGLRWLSQQGNVLIIATTDFHIEKYYDTSHWLYHYSTEQIADLFRQAIEEGMDQWGYRGPLLKRSVGRAGLIKVATSYDRWNKQTEKWFLAAALAHQMTGAPVASHTEHGVLAFEQADFLLAHGVPASSIIIGHIDKNPDPYIHRELAARGVFLEYDSPSRQKYGPDSQAVNLIASAVEHNYHRQILLGMDLARRSYYKSYGGGPGLTYLLTTFLSRLKAEGLEEVVPYLFVENPACAFAFGKKA